MRFVCIDFETNGFPTKGAPFADWPLPFSSYPIQVSVDAAVSVDVVDPDSCVEHIYDAPIRGATCLAPWVRQNVPVSLAELSAAKDLEEIIADLAGLLREGDTIVAHNANFDLNTVLARATLRLEIDTPELRRILEAPRFCTMRCEYSRFVFGRLPKLADLCAHFEVLLEHAHDATADSAALAECLAEALRRGVMLADFGPKQIQTLTDTDGDRRGTETETS
jgi:DNA polymerase III epsilon subunit-like protein